MRADYRPLAPRLPRPVPIAEWHPLGCDCAVCEPYAPSADPRLTSRDLAKLSLAGFAAGTAAAFAIDAPGSAEILVDLLRWWFA